MCIELKRLVSISVAAVNDIAAREEQLEAAREEQFQSYLNSNSNSNLDRSIDYYTNSRADNPSIFKAQSGGGKLADNPGGQTKSLTLTSITNELFPHGCDATADEYVDINEMEFIEQTNEKGQQDENILKRRTHHKKTTKQRKTDECKRASHLFDLKYFL